MKRQSEIAEELKRLAIEHGGLLQPATVVRAARNPKSPLHTAFTWDDKKAAQDYRLWQARELLVRFEMVDAGSGEPINLFLSLTSDRPTKAGYRFSKDVLADPDQRREWLLMAIADLESWRTSYAALTELKPVFAAIARVLAKYAKEEQAA
jgi:hypothetical protein